MAILPEIVPVRMLAKAAVSKAWIAMPLVPVASIVLAFEMTLTVLARIALPSVPVASMVPALLLIFAVVVWMPNLSPLMAPELLTVPPRTEHDTRTVSRHRRTGVDIVGIVVVVDGAVAVEVIRTAIFGVARAGNIRVVAGRRWWEAGRLRLPDRCERRDQQRQHHGVSPQHQLRAGHMHFANTPDFSPTLARANTF